MLKHLLIKIKLKYLKKRIDSELALDKQEILANLDDKNVKKIIRNACKIYFFN